MKIALICPSNLLYMPYVGNYEKILQENHIDYDIINWDRFNIEDENNSLIYRDFKIGHQRNLIDYYKFSKFIKKKLDLIQYKKIIVFGIQLTFLLKDILKRRFKGNYVIDIRDYNKIVRYFRISKVIENSALTVLSSSGFKDWLPESDRYVINHNTIFNSPEEIVTDKHIIQEEIKKLINKDKINIAYIGSIRDYKINIDFIDSLKNSRKIELYFHGEGVVNKDISDYIRNNNITNVKLTGRYERECEDTLYKNSNLINVLIPNDDINSKTLLPNRLYHSVIKMRPIVAFEGTFLSEQVKKYNLGIVLNSFYKVENQIINYLIDFNIDKYVEGRKAFLTNVFNENNKFAIKIRSFINS